MSCELLSTSTPNAHCHQLIGELCIYDVAELKPRLMDLLVPGATRQIECSLITEIDTAGVQLLLLARRVAEKRGCTLKYTHFSDAVREVMSLCHLDADFSDPWRAVDKELSQ